MSICQHCHIEFVTYDCLMFACQGLHVKTFQLVPTPGVIHVYTHMCFCVFSLNFTPARRHTCLRMNAQASASSILSQATHGSSRRILPANSTIFHAESRFWRACGPPLLLRPCSVFESCVRSRADFVSLAFRNLSAAQRALLKLRIAPGIG